jgi:hypothetical protein
VDVISIQTLLTPAGQTALAEAIALGPREFDFLSHFQRLSRQYPANIAKAALEIAILRGEAAAKFPFADELYFSRDAYEQSSSYEVSHYRMKRFQSFDCLVDLCCSVGMDTMSLAHYAPTIGIDVDPLRLVMAQANLDALGVAERVTLVQADLTKSLPLLTSERNTGLFFDPSRRVEHKRLFSVNDYSPPLSLIQDWLKFFPDIGVKISPGVNISELAAYNTEIEFISSKGELKEAVLWFGELKTTHRRATVLPSTQTMVASTKEVETINGNDYPVREPQDYIFEPDPAIIRSGLVRMLGIQLGASQLDRDIAYLTANNHVSTPFARVWAVEAWFPFGLKKLRTYLRKRGIGRVTIKKRGSPLIPEQLIRDLRLSGEGERVVFLTHLSGRPIVVIGIPI